MFFIFHFPFVIVFRLFFQIIFSFLHFYIFSFFHFSFANFLRKAGRGHGPSTLALVYRERVIIVIVSFAFSVSTCPSRVDLTQAAAASAAQETSAGRGMATNVKANSQPGCRKGLSPTSAPSCQKPPSTASQSDGFPPPRPGFHGKGPWSLAALLLAGQDTQRAYGHAHKTPSGEVKQFRIQGATAEEHT